MANGRERFIEMMCEMTGEVSPSEIRQEELAQLIAAQAIDNDIKGEYLYMTIFDDVGVWDGER